jgi:hypothetical protein
MKYMRQEHEGKLSKQEVSPFTKAVQRARGKYSKNPSWFATESRCSVKVKVVML